MNFQIVILLALAACALTLPLPDEEVSSFPKVTSVIEEGVTPAGELTKSGPSTSANDESTNAVISSVTVENPTKPDVETVVKPTEATMESTSIAEDDIKEVPKSMPVVAREETEPIVPPFAGVRAEPKEGVEISEAKSTASSPEKDEMENKSDPKSSGEMPSSTEISTSTTLQMKDEKQSSEDKSKTVGTENKSSSTTPAVAGETMTDESTAEPKKSDKPNLKPKPTESAKDKHAHEPSSEVNKSEESAESKESEESDESNKSK